MHWIYLLKLENDHYYVGETTKLYSKINEHCKPHLYSYNHCWNDKPKWLFGVYNVLNNIIYYEYSKILNNIKNDNDNNFKTIDEVMTHYKTPFISLKKYALDFENNVTLHKMKNFKKHWGCVRGGKYCKKKILENPSKKYLYSRPNCNCPINIPAEIVINNNNNLYFRCVKKNMKWIDMSDYDDIIRVPYKEEPCNFFLKIDINNNYFKNTFNVKESENGNLFLSDSSESD